MSDICYIIGAGDAEFIEIDKKENDFIICADGGFDHALRFEISADLVIGDFDSVSCVVEHKNILTFKSEKDETDMLLAIQIGLEKGYENFVIFGAIGGSRFDHTIANLQLLNYISNKGAFGVLVDCNTLVFALKDSSINLNDDLKGYISIFSLSDKSFGVNISNLKYEAQNSILTNSFPIGVSNEFIGKKSKISVENGSLLISFKGDYKQLLK